MTLRRCKKCRENGRGLHLTLRAFGRYVATRKLNGRRRWSAGKEYVEQ